MEKTNRKKTGQEQPLFLTIQEMQHPEQVFESFFDYDSLPQMRAKLRAWLDAALVGKNGEHAVWEMLHCRMDRLIEAAWIMNCKNGHNATGRTNIAGENRKEVVLPKQDKERYDKRMYYRGYYKQDVQSWLALLFDAGTCDDYILQLEEWCECGLLNDHTVYSFKQEKANLLTFCKGMKELVEAYATLMETEWEIHFTDEHIIDDSDRRMKNGRAEYIIRKFCHTFPRSYARTEMLDLLSEVLEFKKESPETIRHLGGAYERYLCCIDVAYYLSKKMRKRDMKLKTLYAENFSL